jgi:nitrate/nitrite transport system permease protein
MTATTETIAVAPSGGRVQRRIRIPARARAAVAAAGWAAIGAVGFIGLWALIALQAPDLPTPAETWTTFRQLLADAFVNNGVNDKGVGLQLLTSLQRVFSGFAVAALVGIPLGLAIGASPRAYQAINPIVQFLKPVSPLAWFPLGLVAMKNGGHASVFVIFITSLWPTVINTAAGASSVPVDHRNVARVFKFGRIRYLRRVLIPHTLPYVVTGMRLSMGIAWMVIVAVEMLSGNTGVGYFVWNSYNGNNLPAVISAIVLIGGVGLALDNAFNRIGRRVALPETLA